MYDQLALLVGSAVARGGAGVTRAHPPVFFSKK